MPSLESPPSNLLSLEQAAGELRAPVPAVQRAVSLGGLKAVPGFAGQTLFQPEEIRRFAAAGAPNLTPAWKVSDDGRLPSESIDSHAIGQMMTFIRGELRKQLPRQEKVAEWAAVDPSRTQLQIRGQVTSAMRERIAQPTFPGMTPNSPWIYSFERLSTSYFQLKKCVLNTVLGINPRAAKGETPTTLQDSWARGSFRAEVGKMIDAAKSMVPGAWSQSAWDALYQSPETFRTATRYAYANLQKNRFEDSETYQVSIGGLRDKRQQNVTVSVVLPWSELLPPESSLIAASL